MVGGRKKGSNEVHRVETEGRTRLRSVAACVLLNYMVDVMQFNAAVFQICMSCLAAALSQVNTQVTGSMCGYG